MNFTTKFNIGDRVALSNPDSIGQGEWRVYSIEIQRGRYKSYAVVYHLQRPTQSVTITMLEEEIKLYEDPKDKELNDYAAIVLMAKSLLDVAYSDPSGDGKLFLKKAIDLLAGLK